MPCAIKITTASSQALAELRSRTKSVMDELEKDAGTKATIDAIDALRGPATGSDTVAPCSQVLASTSPGSGSTAIDGTWTTTFTKDDLVAPPFLTDQGEINDGNWGDMRVTFENGRVTASQRNSLESSSTSGHTR